MKIYNYNKETKEFITSADATENPLEKGKYLIPANATNKEPLTPKDGFSICFNGGEWEYKEDNRNKTVYSITDKSESKVDYLGVIKDGFTVLVPDEYDEWEVDKWIENSVKKREDKEKLDISEQQKIIESTSWIWEKYNRNVLVLKTMTNDEFYTKYETEINEQENARLKIIELES